MNREDEMIARYILVILRMDLRKVFSWGFQYPKIIPNGLKAYVNGFIYAGYIEITYNAGNELFEVKTFNENGSIKDYIQGISFDKLISVIDNLVEYCDNYEEKVYESCVF